jgi:lipoprotein signal peptidase
LDVNSPPDAKSKLRAPWPPLATLFARGAAVLALVALDLWSKAYVFAQLGPPLNPLPGSGFVRDAHGHPRQEILGDWLAFMTTLNPGMAWGFNRLPTHVLVYGRCVAVLVLVWLVVRNPRHRRVMSAALVLVLAGAMGNLYDNLFMPSGELPFGQVRDFIDVYFRVWDWHFPTFNVADSCISVGAVLLFLSSWSKDPATPPAPQPD